VNNEALSSLVRQVIPIAESAGDAILTVAARIPDAQTKADGSPVTEADLASNDIIQNGLQKLLPTFPIISEETDLGTAESNSFETFWLVDPLDGTKEFIKGLGEYTVNIALVERTEPILGVIYLPALRVLYYGARGCGSWKQTEDDGPQRIKAKTGTRPMTAVVSRSHLSTETEALLAQLNITNTTKHGSSLKMCAVAEGRAHIYPRLGTTCLWDTAAGTAIAREAGCLVKDLSGQDLCYDPAKGLTREAFIVYAKDDELVAEMKKIWKST